MKKILLTCVALLLVTTLQAEEYDTMIGLEFAQTRGEVSDSTSDWSNSFGLRLGGETEHSRVYVNYNFIDTETVSTVTYQSQVLELNLEAKTDLYFSMLRGFAGAHGGVISSNLKSSTRDESYNDLIYGAQGGMLVEFTDYLYLELGYRYSLTEASSEDVNFETVESLYGALNFRF